MSNPNTSVKLRCLDIRARWTRWLTFLGGSVFGLLFDWEDLLPALRHQPYTDGPHSPGSLLGLFIGGTVLPVAVAFLAPRKSFLWATAALLVQLAWSLLDRVAAHNVPGLLQYLRGNGASALVNLLLFCGPISLVRLLIRRRQDGKTQRLAAQHALMRQAAEHQPGVWPPPVNPHGYSEHR